MTAFLTYCMDSNNSPYFLKICYNLIMKKPLIETNPYLKDPIMRDKLISRSVRSSCGVEGIKIDVNAAKIEIPRRGTKKIYEKMKASIAAK